MKQHPFISFPGHFILIVFHDCLSKPLYLNGNLSENWKNFKQKWHNYAIIMYLHRQPQQYQIVLLCHMLGDDVLKLYNDIQFPTANEQQTPEEIFQAFNRYAVGETNVTYEHFVLHMRK